MASLMLTPKILLVSNLRTTLPLWAFTSLQQRPHVILESQPANVLRCWLEEAPDIIIFDIAPIESLSMNVIKALRTEAVIPILLLTSAHTDKSLLEAYEAGVDECILKPIDPLLFHAKLMAWLRRLAGIPGEPLDSIKVGNVQLIPTDQMIVVGDHEPVRLTDYELRLLSYLMERPGHAVTIKELCHHVWGQTREGNKGMLKNVIYRLRRKVEADPARPAYIQTVARVGYQFVGKEN